MKINYDGAAKGCPGEAGIGYIFRNDLGDFQLVLVKGIDIVDNYTVKCRAIIDGVEKAISRGWLGLVEKDSATASLAFKDDQYHGGCRLDGGEPKLK
ncbi:hypothetical protein FRX31_025556 [Thalictrum thalictroides]|uniref:RNase H type-1 domain-containing protein n=1 Tax=Thalictrum thalictroides TaxID=46969 RepID=A0A7J6VJT8_THATH|nr:hypothetical protein FRX31_025556 [Thalictrum thalictroides]